MKKTYVISFFLVLLILDLCALFAYFMITGSLSGKSDSYHSSIEEESPGTAIFTDTQKEPVITRDTKYTLERYDAQNYSLQELVLDVPIEMLGMNREQLCDYLEKYELDPTLEDINHGFLKVELLSFSQDKIILRKYYEGSDSSAIEEQESKFILLAERGFIVVYENDYEHFYMSTDIGLSKLSYELQQEILDGKLLPDKKALYDFLESYSS